MLEVTHHPKIQVDPRKIPITCFRYFASTSSELFWHSAGLFAFWQQKMFLVSSSGKNSAALIAGGHFTAARRAGRIIFSVVSLLWLGIFQFFPALNLFWCPRYILVWLSFCWVLCNKDLGKHCVRQMCGHPHLWCGFYFSFRSEFDQSPVSIQRDHLDRHDGLWGRTSDWSSLCESSPKVANCLWKENSLFRFLSCRCQCQSLQFSRIAFPTLSVFFWNLCRQIQTPLVRSPYVISVGLVWNQRQSNKNPKSFPVFTMPFSSWRITVSSPQCKAEIESVSADSFKLHSSFSKFVRMD